MQEPKKNKKNSKSTISPPLSVGDNVNSLSDIREKVFSSLNNSELERSLDYWLQENYTESKIAVRDFGILKNIITEYLDAFIVFGYNPKGERIIIQHCNNPKDRDAIMEFLKTIFLKQQNENFLDGDEE